MTDSRIQQICNEISVCVSCYKKVHAHLKNSSRCHICFHPVVRCPNYSHLRWIGDEQVICCDQSSCEKQIRNLDQLDKVLTTGKHYER